MDSVWRAEGHLGAVAAGIHPLTAEAAIDMLRRGGNSADGAAASIFVLSIADGGHCFGGEVPIIYYDAQRKIVEVIAGQGVAPRLATLEQMKATGGIPLMGLRAATVPGSLDACLTLLARHGTMRFKEVIEPSLSLLERRLFADSYQEQPWHSTLAATLHDLIAAEKKGSGDRLSGLRRVRDAFYQGEPAHQIDAWCREHDGLLRYSDLATHVTRIEDPVQIKYREYTVCKCGPWTQGPWMLQALQLLEPLNLRSMGHNTEKYIHTVTEAMKLALADRDEYYADPLFETVPLASLLSEKYVALRRPLIGERASIELRPGDPNGMQPLLEKSAVPPGVQSAARDTTTCLVADRWGNWVAATPSGWSGALVETNGVWLGSRLQSLNLWSDHPNRIEPGKRPRITLTPTLVLKNGTPVLAISVAGGDMQDQASLQLFLNAIEFGFSPAEALTKPHFYTDHFVGSFGQAPPKHGALRLTPGIHSAEDALAERGHKVTIDQGLSCCPVMLGGSPQEGYQAGGDAVTLRNVGAW